MFSNSNNDESILNFIEKNTEDFEKDISILLKLGHIVLYFKRLNDILLSLNPETDSEEIENLKSKINEVFNKNIIPIFDYINGLDLADIKKLLEKNNDFLSIIEITKPQTDGLKQFNDKIKQLNIFLKNRKDLLLQKENKLAQIESIFRKIKAINDSEIDFVKIEHYIAVLEKIDLQNDLIKTDREVIGAICNAKTLIEVKFSIQLKNFSKEFNSAIKIIEEAKKSFNNDCNILLDKISLSKILESIEKAHQIQLVQKIANKIESFQEEKDLITKLQQKFDAILPEFPNAMLNIFEENINFHENFSLTQSSEALNDFISKYEKNKQILEALKVILITSKASTDSYKKLNNLNDRLEKITNEAKELLAKRKKELEETKVAAEKLAIEAKNQHFGENAKKPTLIQNNINENLLDANDDHPLLIKSDNNPNEQPNNQPPPRDNPLAITHIIKKTSDIEEDQDEKEESFFDIYGSAISYVTQVAFAFGAVIGGFIGGVSGLSFGGGVASVPAGLAGALALGGLAGAAFSVIGFITITSLCAIDHLINMVTSNHERSDIIDDLENTSKQGLDNLKKLSTSYTSSLKDISLKNINDKNTMNFKDSHLPVLISETRTEIDKQNNQKIVTHTDFVSGKVKIKNKKLS